MSVATSPTPERVAKNRAIILDRLRSDFNAREDRVHHRLSSRFPGVLGFPMRKAAEAVMAFMNKRHLPDYIAEATGRFLDHVQAGNVHTLKDGEAMGNLLQLFDHAHPRYSEVFDNLDRAQYTLMKLYERLLAAEGESYPEIVRSAFPRKQEVKGLASEALAFAMQILHIVDRERDLLHVNGAVRWPLVRVIHSLAEQLDEITMSDIDEIYAADSRS